MKKKISQKEGRSGLTPGKMNFLSTQTALRSMKNQELKVKEEDQQVKGKIRVNTPREIWWEVIMMIKEDRKESRVKKGVEKSREKY